MQEFDYLNYDEVNDYTIRSLRMQFEGVARYLQRLPPSRAAQSAITSLESAYMFAAKAIRDDRLKHDACGSDDDS